MPNILKELAAADATVGADVIGGEIQARVPYDRWLISVGCTGSAAAGDFAFTLVIGQEEIGPFRNSATGLGQTQDTQLQLREFVPANMVVSGRITDAANSNPVLTRLEFVRAGA